MDFFRQICSGAMLPYTILLGVVVFYWLVVIAGFLDIDVLDFLGFGLDGAAEGAAEAATEAAAEAAAEGAAEAMTDGIDGSLDALDGSEGLLNSVLGFLNLGRVPVTIIFSFIVLQMWVMAYLFNWLISPRLVQFVPAVVLGIVAFAGTGVVSLFLAGLTTRPFRDVFKTETTHGAGHLVGSTCKIKTSRVTPKFGQAELKVEDSFLLIAVRCAEDAGLKRGDEAVIVGFNEERNTYDIRKL